MIAERLERVRLQISEAATRSGRVESDVQLVAVSKAQPASSVRAAYEAGHRIFGESRAQELVAKAEDAAEDLVWHFIGPLQRNKVRLVRPLVAALHSLDRDSLAAAWAGEDVSDPGPPVFVQVRLGGESTKHGFEPADCRRAVEHAVGFGLQVIGLMTIPPFTPEPEDARAWFVQLRELRDSIAADHPAVEHLSMGMSHDYVVAIEEGATVVRVGSAIFGPRSQH